MKRKSRIMAALLSLWLMGSLILLAEPGGIALAQKPVPVKNPDGTTTTPGIRDERYGSGGTMDETTDERGRVTKRVWKDGRGNTMESELTEYGLGSGKWIETRIFNRLPNGFELKRVTTTRTDEVGNTISTTTETYEKGKRNGGTKTETDLSGRSRTYKLDPAKQIWMETNVDGTPLTSGQGGSSTAQGFAVASEAVGGLNTTTFTTPRGKVRVNLPDDMAAGDTLSGTVIAEALGKNDKERAANQGELSGYVVELEQQQASSTSRILKSAIPTASNTTYLILRDKDRKEVAKIEVPVAQQPPPVEKFDLPTLGQQGRAIEVTGRFDGDFSTTNVKVGGEDLEVLAESPRKVVARNSDNKIGPTELAVEERGQITKGEFHSLGIKLSAPKLNLLRGEQTTLTVTVHGLEGIREDVPLVLENKSVEVITMGEQNVERIIISPAQVQAGSYTINRQLTGIQPGGFTITGTVTATTNRGQARSLVLSHD